MSVDLFNKIEATVNVLSSVAVTVLSIWGVEYLTPVVVGSFGVITAVNTVVFEFLKLKA